MCATQLVCHNCWALTLEPVLHNKRSRHNEKSAHHNRVDTAGHNWRKPSSSKEDPARKKKETKGYFLYASSSESFYSSYLTIKLLIPSAFFIHTLCDPFVSLLTPSLIIPRLQISNTEDPVSYHLHNP